MAVIRLWLVLLALQAVFFLALRLYLRLRRAENLRSRWRKRHPQSVGGRAEAAFIARGMAGFERGPRARLPFLVFVLPNLAVLVIVYLVNWR